MLKNLYIFVASVCVALGVIGIFIPIMPTTPFLLLAIFMYMRSSKSGVRMILRNKYLSPYVYSYLSKKGIPLKILMRTLSLLWVTLAIGMIWATDNLYVRIFLMAVGIGVTLHLYSKREK